MAHKSTRVFFEMIGKTGRGVPQPVSVNQGIGKLSGLPVPFFLLMKHPLDASPYYTKDLGQKSWRFMCLFRVSLLVANDFKLSRGSTMATATMTAAKAKRKRSHVWVSSDQVQSYPCRF